MIMHNTPNNHATTRRLQYLQAMGITAWQQRPTMQTAGESEQISDVLIWAQAAEQQQWVNILQDLQALCLHAQSNNANKPSIINSQPDTLASTTHVLAIGLSAQQQTWLADKTNQFTVLPAISGWAGDTVVKRKVWASIQEVLWLL